MRKLLFLVFAFALVPGCMQEPADDGEPVGDDLPGMVGNGTAPAPLHWEADVTVAADPFNMVPVGTPVGGGAPCSTDVSGCDFYEFTVNASVSLAATLAWELAANDLDLYLYQGSTEISRDGINDLTVNPMPTNTQVMRADVPPGTYTFWVALWNAADETYTLDVAFE